MIDGLILGALAIIAFILGYMLGFFQGGRHD